MRDKIENLRVFFHRYFVFVILFVLFTVFCLILIKFIYSKTLHRNHKFVIFLTLLSSFGAIALAATLILTIYYRQEDEAETSFQNYDTIWKKQNELLQEFVEHPEMEYFYLDLYGESSVNKGHHYTRNITLERNFFNMVMNNISTIVSYLDAKKYSSSENTERVKDRFNKLLKLHVKSKYFLEYWKSYKQTVAPIILIKYMKENFNI